MSAPPWNFEGYVTAAGNRIVQDWFWNEANDEERGALRDRANYLANLKKTLWMEPYFKWFGKQGYGEIRKRVPRGALRVYGTFADDRGAFVFLFGHTKKATKEPEGMDAAEKRLKRYLKGESTTHGFDFEDKSPEKNSQG